MNNLKDIEDNYARMDTEKLIHITNKPQDLRLDVISILQKELLKRGLNDEAMSITEFLIQSKENPSISDMTEDQLKAFIKERLDSGEPLENVKIDLKEEGINIFDFISDDSKLKEKAFDYLVSLKQKGLQEDEIDEKLMRNLSMDKEETEILKFQLGRKGKQNLIFGYTLLIVGSLVLIFTLGVQGRITIGGLLFLSLGIWRVYVGYEQLKK